MPNKNKKNSSNFQRYYRILLGALLQRRRQGRRRVVEMLPSSVVASSRPHQPPPSIASVHHHHAAKQPDISGSSNSSSSQYNSNNNNNRTRHPAGSNNNNHRHQAIGQSISLITPTIEYTSTSDFRRNESGRSTPPPPIRLRNVYKKGGENSKGLISERSNGLIDAQKQQLDLIITSSSSAVAVAVEKTPKRENWLHKSLLRSSKPSANPNGVAAGGRRGSYQPPPTTSSSANSHHLAVPPLPKSISISSDRSPNGDSNTTDAPKKSPLPIPRQSSGNPLVGLIERLRPRSGSDAIVPYAFELFSRRKKGGGANASAVGARRQSVDSPVGSDQIRNISGISPVISKSWLSKRRVSTPLTSLSSPTSELDEEEEEDDEEAVSWMGDPIDEKALSPVRRKRSTSDSARFLILRKTSRPNTTEVMGCISRNEVPYKQLLKKFTCFDLMPKKGALVAIDSHLSTRLALVSLAENGVRAGFLWDSKQHLPLCLLTVTDFLVIIRSHLTTVATVQHLSDVLERPILSNLIHARNFHSSHNLPKRSKLTSASADDQLLSALKILRLNRLHRIPIMEPETGNPLYLLSLKRLLLFLHTHMNNLPRTSMMYKSLDELRLGTWIDATTKIVDLAPDDKILAAVEKFLQSGASSLPVLLHRRNSEGASSSSRRLIDALTKVDLMHFVLVNGWNNLHETTVSDVLKQRSECMEKLITCHVKTPLALAIDRLVLSHSHRMYVTDSDGVLCGVISIGDVLGFFNEQSADECNGLPNNNK